MDTPAAETELEMVKRHVREGQGRLDEQRARVELLRAKGLSTTKATTILILFEDVQRLHEDHLARIEGDGGRREAVT